MKNQNNLTRQVKYEQNLSKLKVLSPECIMRLGKHATLKVSINPKWLVIILLPRGQNEGTACPKGHKRLRCRSLWTDNRNDIELITSAIEGVVTATVYTVS